MRSWIVAVTGRTGAAVDALIGWETEQPAAAIAQMNREIDSGWRPRERSIQQE
jgi:hypothetical protein